MAKEDKDVMILILMMTPGVIYCSYTGVLNKPFITTRNSAEVLEPWLAQSL